MKKNILSVIKDHFNSYSKGQKRIALYIIDHCDKAAFMTAKVLGRTTSVSESTVVRFATELGYDGYPAMQKAMQQVVLNQLNTVEDLEEVKYCDESEDVLTSVFHTDMENLRKTSDILNRNDFQMAVQAITKGRRIYIIGVGAVSALAIYTGYHLKYMFPDVRTITDSAVTEILDQLIEINSKDVVITFEFQKGPVLITEAVRYCHDAGATVLTISNTDSTVLKQFADYVLVAKCDTSSIVGSFVAPLSLLDAILVALSQARGDYIQNKAKMLEDALKKYHIYEE